MNSKVGRKSILLLIDPLRDFHAGGSLAFPGADADSERIAEMILSISEHWSNREHGYYWSNGIYRINWIVEFIASNTDNDSFEKVEWARI